MCLVQTLQGTALLSRHDLDCEHFAGPVGAGLGRGGEGWQAPTPTAGAVEVCGQAS